jgi:hypothetical protein
MMKSWMIGLHHTRTTRHWSDEESLSWFRSPRNWPSLINTRIYTDKKREAETTQPFWKSPTLNARSIWRSNVAVLERALSLVARTTARWAFSTL